MKKEQINDKVIHCFECEKETGGWCTLYERVVYPDNFCDFGIKKSKITGIIEKGDLKNDKS